MRSMIVLFVCVAFAMTLHTAPAAADTGMSYQHYYNWLRDDDGDGIPNHLDDDWTAPEDGSGYQVRHGFKYPVAAVRDAGDGAAYQYNHRKRIEDANATGSFLRFMKRIRGGSCE